MNVKAMLVDDEPLALQHLAEELEQIGGWEIIGKYRNPKTALEHLDKERPQVLFLDIEMPEMNGITLAERALEICPEVIIVFVTVYEEYAVKAFELSAQDYILKPLHPDRLIKTTSRVIQQLQLQKNILSSSNKSVKVHMFRSLQFERSGQAPITPRWKTWKAQELFAFLLHYRGRPVRKQALLDQLWPDIEWKKGITQLYTAIYQIRKLLHEERVNIEIANCDEGYRLDLNDVVLDIEEWENRLAESTNITEDRLVLHKELAGLYRGDYLVEYSYIWAETEKRRLRTVWLQHVKQIADYLLVRNQDEEAARHYLQTQNVIPQEETIYFELMLIFARLGDRDSVEKQYELLTNMLRQHFDVLPKGEVQIWFNNWQRIAYRPE